MVDLNESPDSKTFGPYIFNIGLNRAGTTSLSAALEALGIQALHWRYRETRLFDIIRSNIRSGLPLLAGPDKEFRAFSDFAGQYFFKDLDRCYPGSKFIVTTRDLESWLQSREKKVMKNKSDPHYKYGFTVVDRDRWTHEYHALHHEARRYFADRNQDFLIMNIPAGDGWSLLCPFLGVKEPAVPFPSLNALPGRALRSSQN